ncbi:Electron transport complex protein RnfC [hydrothermal vent metagenome]|uniref:Electron transport complex protein RnfC n=1 Tax=hydrothermal vent metagenome TaxID=652676 RepID=A0A3B0Y2E9_9ZZZZ
MVTLLEKPASFHGGLHLPSKKSQSLTEPVKPATIPKRLFIPLSQNIGEPAEPVVKTGDKVLRGQLIARSLGYISAPVHASTSGIISDIGDYPVPHPSGLSAACIVIDSDGEDRAADTGLKMENVFRAEPADIRQRVRDAGIVGLGGAGFPTAVKLNPGPDREVSLLVINGAECEPYISCDEALMCCRPDDIIEGIRIMRYALQAKQVVIGIEDNMPNAIKYLQDALTRLDETDIRIAVVPTRYPAGGEKQLIYALTGEEVPSQGLPIDLGIVCHNVGTAAAVARAVHHGEPLISRIITVTGAGISQPCNLDVRIGTPIASLVEQCGGYTSEVARLLVGGPMMGFALRSDQLPVIKTSNCILATSIQETPDPTPASACIRCAQCVDVCPANLLPQQLYWYAFARDMEKIQDYNLFDCIECGCCAQVCPSHIPLVQYYRFAKTEIWDMEREREKSDLARRRHEARQARLEREKKALEERRARARKALDKKPKAGDASAKKAEIAAALARVKTRKTEQTDVSPRNTDNLTPEQRMKIDEVDRRRVNKVDGA